MIDLKKNEEALTQDLLDKVKLDEDKEKLEKHVVSLSKTVVNLSKQNEIDLGDVKAKVVIALDYSGSMERLYNNETVQKTLNRLVPLGLKFDDNGEIDVFLFENSYKELESMTINNYSDYVKNVIKKSKYRMGGTKYGPVLNAIVNKEKKGFFKKVLGSNETQPTFVLFITDGDNYDKDYTNKVIIKSSKKDIFIQFVGIGSDRFEYLTELDNLEGRKIDNTGFTAMEDLNDVSDKDLYTKILEQFVKWLKERGY